MPTLKNISPLGDLDVVLVGRTVCAGEEFEVSDEHAKWLLEQADVYAPVDDAAKAIAAELAAPVEEAPAEPVEPADPTDPDPNDASGE